MSPESIPQKVVIQKLADMGASHYTHATHEPTPGRKASVVSIFVHPFPNPLYEFKPPEGEEWPWDESKAESTRAAQLGHRGPPPTWSYQGRLVRQQLNAEKTTEIMREQALQAGLTPTDLDIRTVHYLKTDKGIHVTEKLEEAPAFVHIEALNKKGSKWVEFLDLNLSSRHDPDWKIPRPEKTATQEELLEKAWNAIKTR